MEAVTMVRRSLRLLLLVLLSAHARAEDQQFIVEGFSLPTADGLAQINGEIDLPLLAPSRSLPALLLVHGTHFFDRDYEYGNSNTDRDLLFQDLANFFTHRGVAVVRFDYRGVSCSHRTMPPCSDCDTQEKLHRHFVTHCIDNNARSHVTPASIQDDIAAVFSFAKLSGFVDPSRIVILAHSEGTIHVPALLQARRIDPIGLVMIGMVAESPKSMIHWQYTDRLTSAYMAPDTNGDDVVSQEELGKFCKDNALENSVCARFMVGTRQQAADIAEDIYRSMASEALSHADAEPFSYIYPGAIYASYAWWKMFLIDDVEPVSKLVDFAGKVSFNNGASDCATPGDREFAVIASHQERFKIPPHLNLYSGRGHSLGTACSVGPIPEDSMQRLNSEVAWVLRSEN